jgi:hypothetical protein
MTPRRLRSILDGAEDLGLFVFPDADGRPGWTPDALLADWRAAAAEANAAYAEWRRRADRVSYTIYRACADRADAAQDALARRKGV